MVVAHCRAVLHGHSVFAGGGKVGICGVVLIEVKAGAPCVRFYGAMRKELLSLARAEVPRYTSYPTAAQFHDGVDEAVYRQWLGELTSEQSLSLYQWVLNDFDDSFKNGFTLFDG